MKKAIALFLVIALLAGGLYYLRRVDQMDKQRMRELYTQVEPLQREKETLIAERNSLETDYALQMRDIGTVELLFRELNKEIFTKVYPLMRDRGIIGGLGVCTQEYPGYGGKLTVEQYSRLVKDGWGTCIIYEKVGNFSKWFADLSYKLEHDGLPIPTTIFFPDNTYDSEIDQELIDCGFNTVIHSADDGHSATVTSVRGLLWHTGAMPWNYTGVNSDTELLALTSGANLVFTISFKNLWDAYEQDAFVKTLDNWVSMLAVDDSLLNAAEPTPTPKGSGQDLTAEDELLKPLLKVVDCEKARQLHLEAEANNVRLAREQTRREAELDARIATLDEQIRAIYDQWGQSGAIITENRNEQ